MTEYRTNTRARRENTEDGNCFYQGGELLRLDARGRSIVECWERLECFVDLVPAFFDAWKHGRQTRSARDDVWRALGVKNEPAFNPFDALGDTQPENADFAFTSGHDKHGRPQQWRRMQRGGADPSPLVRIYCTAPDKQGNREAMVFWLPDRVECCEEYNRLMALVRESLRELGAIETLRVGLRPF